MDNFKYDEIVFHDGKNTHYKGTIIGNWYENRDTWGMEPCAEPILDLYEIEAVLDYLQNQGYGWMIIDGKVRIFKTKEEYYEYCRTERETKLD